MEQALGVQLNQEGPTGFLTQERGAPKDVRLSYEMNRDHIDLPLGACHFARVEVQVFKHGSSLRQSFFPRASLSIPGVLTFPEGHGGSLIDVLRGGGWEVDWNNRFVELSWGFELVVVTASAYWNVSDTRVQRSQWEDVENRVRKDLSSWVAGDDYHCAVLVGRAGVGNRSFLDRSGGRGVLTALLFVRDEEYED